MSKLSSFAIAVLMFIVCSEVSASDWQSDEQTTPGVIFGDGYIRSNGVKYVPESKALQLAERQALAQEQIAARLEELLTVVAVTDKQPPAK